MRCTTCDAPLGKASSPLCGSIFAPRQVRVGRRSPLALHGAPARRLGPVKTAGHLPRAMAPSVRVAATPLQPPDSGPRLQVVVLVPGGSAPSPYGPSWESVMLHVAQRVDWSDVAISLRVLTTDELERSPGAAASDIASSSVLLAIGLSESASPAARSLTSPTGPIGAAVTGVPIRMLFDCARDLDLALSALPGFSPHTSPAPTALDQQLAKVPGIGGQAAALIKGRKSYDTAMDLFRRKNSDDLVFLVLFLVDRYVRRVKLLPNQDPDLYGIYKMLSFGYGYMKPRALLCALPENGSMLGFCGEPIIKCVRHPVCSKALDELTKAGINDQVAAYRAIVTYECPELQDFSLCVLQKHNCLGNSAEIPMRPDPAPIEAFHGRPLTWAASDSIFYGRLGESQEWSWKVIGGKNAAYDKFPCQIQLFYPGKAKNTIWYDPHFKVVTLDGRTLWRRRHYRVRRGGSPGRYYFTVLDNGVTSNEYWRILDADEEMTFAVFYYSGAASVAGINYAGAVICTDDGEWPQDKARADRIEAALERAGIKGWEVSRVDQHCGCTGAPLGIREGI